MSLNFDLTAVPEEVRSIEATRDGDPNAGEDFKKGDRITSPVTNALIWGCMGIGIGTITEGNYREWYARFELQERVHGRSLRYYDASGQIVDRPITLADVKAHIGLKTNVFPKRTATRFLKQLTGCVLDEADRARERDEKKRQAKTPDALREVSTGS